MGGSSSSTTRQVTDIPADFKPFFQDVFSKAQTAANQVNTQPFQGQFFADVDPLQQQALSQQQALAQQLQSSGFGQNVTDLANRTIAGDFLDPNQQFLQDQVQAALRPAKQALQGNLGNLQAQLVNAGQDFGNSARGQLAGQGLLQSAATGFGDTAANIIGQNTARERAFQNAAPQLLAFGQQLQQLPSQLLGQVGDARRAFAQQSVDEQIAQFEEANTAPFRAVNPFAQVIQGFNVGSNSSTISPNTFNRAASIGSGALGGAAAGSSFGPWGAGIGAVLGGGLGGIQ